MKELKNAIYLGILGNQANRGGMTIGEPSGLVPIYSPIENKIGRAFELFPFSYSKITIPVGYDSISVEPEILLDCDVKYYNGKISYVIPKRFTASNNPTIPKFSISKISQKKNWGQNSKGIAKRWIDIDIFESGGILSQYQIVSFVKKKDEFLQQYSIDISGEDYPYMYQKLIDWLIVKIKEQEEILNMENIFDIMKESQYPNRMLLSLGSVPVLQEVEHISLEEDDEVFIVLYDKRFYRPNSIKAYVLAYKTRNANYDNMIILHQRVYKKELIL
jgi:replicative DNA helicase